METKVFVVEVHTMMSFGGGLTDSVFFSKEDAEFYCWQKNKEQKGGYGYVYHLLREIPAKTVQKDAKEYKKFIAEQIEELDKKIKAKLECAEKDTKAIEELTLEKENYAKQYGE